jgi:hypothetical protein
MENKQPDHRSRDALSMVADMLNHCDEIRLDVSENLSDLIQAALNCVKARGRRFPASIDWPTWCGQLAALEYGIKVLRFPAERYRQRFQSSRATAPFDSVPLDFTHDRDRYMRAFGKFALAPSKLSHTLIDGLSDRSPILRHSIPPRSTFGAEVSGSGRFRGTPRGLDSRDQANCAHMELKSSRNR